MYKSKVFLGLLVITVLVVSVFGCGKKDETVAIVNGEKITRTMLDQQMEKMKQMYEGQGADFESEQGKAMLKSLESQILDGMVDEKIMLQEAEKQNLVPSKEEVEQQVEETKSKFASVDKFNEALKNYSMTVEDFKDWTRTSIANERLYEKVTKDASVTEEEIKAFYEKNKDQYQVGEQVRAKHILIKFDTPNETVGRSEEQALEQINGILKEYEEGADFGELAQKYSEDPGSKDKGGEYTFGQGWAVPEFEQAAFGLEVGQVTKEPVKVSYGYHIIKLEEKIPAKEQTFEEVQGGIQAQLLQQKKQEAFGTYIEDLKQKATIEIKLPKTE